MEGITLIETASLQKLFDKLETMSEQFNQVTQELRELKKPYLTAQDLMEITGFSKTWVNNNKQLVGYSMVGGCLRFKRADVMEFMESGYYKAKRKL